LKEYKIEDHLKNEKEILMYLKEVLEDGDPQLIISALDDIKRCVIKNNNQRL
jgi:DNA-binding phage protein